MRTYFLLIMLVMLPFAAADHFSVSELGFHPDSLKRAALYTDNIVQQATLHDASTDATVTSFPLEIPFNYEGYPVNCQGNLPCRIADFSGFDYPGTYYLSADGHQTSNFTISADVYEQNIGTLLELFNALLQQNSAYHPDMHSAHQPPFGAMADGSFILEADQISAASIRLGSAYNRNPQLLSHDNYDILTTGAPDAAEYLTVYAKNLMALQGVVMETTINGQGLRTGTGMSIERAFMPSEVTQSTATVYYSSNGGDSEQVNVESLCGPDDGTAQWDDCMLYAHEYYKCADDEVCLELRYDDTTGRIVGRQGYDVSIGWTYEFQCYPDIRMDEPVFDQEQDRCLVFKDDTSLLSSVRALHAMAQMVPAVHDVDSDLAQLLAARALNTQRYLDERYAFDGGDATAHYASALFLLYDYTGDEAFLYEAHSKRDVIAKNFVSDHTPGNEFYWEQYALHKEDIESAGLQYLLDSNPESTPENLFRGKIYFDYKDRWVAISDTGERVFDFTPGAGDFHDSRPMLVEGALGAKAADLHSSPEPFIIEVADSQLAWLTGLNRVQDGIGTNESLRSYSFIHGIGDNPDSQHTRYMLDSGFDAATNGAIVGARSTQFFFDDPDSPGTFVEYDGYTDILGQLFGSNGNQWRGEEYNDPFKPVTYNNGKTLIDGWISGAYDVPDEDDVIFNFDDDVSSWRFTETTNEIGAAAVELFSYLDAQRNGKDRVSMPRWSVAMLEGTDDGLSSEFTHDSGGAVCGNAVIESGEQCDDGNVYSGDGCSSTCQIESTEAVCGDGVVEGAEQCDDGNVYSGDGCSSTCIVEDTTCADTVHELTVQCTAGTITSDTSSSTCRTVLCSDGDQAKACDKSGYFEIYNQAGDGNICFGDTCLDGWGYKQGEYCTQPEPVCGNSLIEDGETCDDGNTQSGDGCSATCQTEPTQAVCGDGVIEGAEQCDDGNIVNGDGCSSTCQQEVDTACYNQVTELPATCNGGTFTTDSKSGSCRTLVCEGSGSSMQVLACDKPDGNNPEYFEMYKQSQTGDNIQEICLADTCITNGEYDGYERGSGYPICTGEENQSDPVCGNGEVESGETCDDGNTISGDGCSSSCQEESAQSASVNLRIKDWYPQGLNVVFVCEESGYNATSYVWSFGDGNSQTTISDNVYHTYQSSGDYEVICEASNGMTESDTLQIRVE